MTLLLAVLLGLAVGWCWGHTTARIRHVPVGATAAQDEAAFLVQAITELNGACCDRWWTSAGTDHDPICPNSHRSSAA